MTEMTNARALRDSITRSFATGDFEHGMKLFEEARSELPEVIQLECLGNLYFYQRQFQDAVNKYEAAIKIDPHYYIARYQYLIGGQKEKQRDFVSAFKRYQNAIEIEPTFIDAYIELGGLLLKVGDLEGALRCYRDAVKLDPEDLANWNNLKNVLILLKKTAPAVYDQELSAAEAECKRLSALGRRLPSGHEW